MALSKTVEFKSEQVKDCYISVSVFYGTKHNISFNLAYRVERGMFPFQEMSFTCSYSLDAGNPLEQAYAYLKTLPEFADAVDC